MPVAIITGASSGLGQSFFRAILTQCPEIDEIWLIARRKERLEALAATAPQVRALAIPLDLCAEDDITLLRRVLEVQKPDLRLLINNAGFGKLGDFLDSDPNDQVAMTALNVGALTQVSALCLPYLGEGGLVLNVSSVASFVPTPGMAVYGATKAYVKSFTAALGYELKDRGIHALAVCPGPMDTEFNTVAGIGGGTSPTFESLPREDPDRIAQGALAAGLRGKGLYTGRFFYKFYHFLSKMIPTALLLRFTDL